MSVGFRYESEMTQLVAAAAPRWWPRGLNHDFVAAEIVGPDAVADLVGIRFDQRRLADREANGISPVVDALALRALQACRGRTMSTGDLANICDVTRSGMQRALGIALEANAIVRHRRGHYACHSAWAPVGARLVAVELKLENWRAAFYQAEAYSQWANATWVILARKPPTEARVLASSEGFGLAVLRTDGKILLLERPRPVRRPREPWAALWASEQTLARAVSAGHCSDVALSSARSITAQPAMPATGVVASLRSA